MDGERLAELLASLGVATDVAAGLDMETSARATVLAVDLARDVGPRGESLRGVYYPSMPRFRGAPIRPALAGPVATMVHAVVEPSLRIPANAAWAGVLLAGLLTCAEDPRPRPAIDGPE